MQKTLTRLKIIRGFNCYMYFINDYKLQPNSRYTVVAHPWLSI